MYDGVGLTSALMDTLKDCNNAIDQLMNDGLAMASARQKYRVALARTQLELREVEKLPATLINDVSRGDPECAALKFDLERCEVAYEATKQRIMLRKREADIIREQINREYAQGGLNG